MGAPPEAPLPESPQAAKKRAARTALWGARAWSQPSASRDRLQLAHATTGTRTVNNRRALCDHALRTALRGLPPGHE
eukprot:4741542-Prymnesium_polylepis.2